MPSHAGHISTVALAGLALLACSSPATPPSSHPTEHGNPAMSHPTSETGAAGRAAVEGLPFAQGRSFATLDGYLAFLKDRSAMDVPWYEEISPGRYRLNRGRGDRFAEPEFHSRAELAAKFGFSE